MSDTPAPQNTRPHVLVVAPWSPYPLIFGGAIRLYYIIRMLAEFADVTLISYVSYDGDIDEVAHLETICRRVVMVPSKPVADGRLRARSVLSRRSFQWWSHHSADMQRAIDTEARQQKFDAVVYELSQMGLFNYRVTGAPVVLDMANIEHELISRRADVTGNLLRRWALRWEAFKFRHEEMRICRDADLILVTSDRERDLMRQIPGLASVETIANTVDPDFFHGDNYAPEPDKIVFIGTTHVDANRDGVRWFAEEVLPLIRRQRPDVRFDIVGGTPPPDIQALDEPPNVRVLGFVDDVRDYMATARVMVVPLRSGGGTRLKIIEGLSFGVPTVSTTLGAEGLDLVPGRDILIADEPQAIADEILRVLTDDDVATSLTAHGKSVARALYSWRASVVPLRVALSGVAPTVDP
jgi:glycosyltransferase involved in cell wall biosynthesis